MAQAKPRTTSAGALTAPSFEPAQDLSVTPFSALTAEESSAISYELEHLRGGYTNLDLTAANGELKGQWWCRRR